MKRGRWWISDIIHPNLRGKNPLASKSLLNCWRNTEVWVPLFSRLSVGPYPLYMKRKTTLSHSSNQTHKGKWTCLLLLFWFKVLIWIVMDITSCVAFICYSLQHQKDTHHLVLRIFLDGIPPVTRSLWNIWYLPAIQIPMLA